ncbi:hypothetical protein Acr_03g0003940 [Actinidia rufa]|uniref:Uncharacterized protein n=1 Tax=Actinidia rufa TaxID=165716 RepID=A0A7J0EB51_9ERIC|nr:hypothetical protein Acr_03g0003940 [Actinidia rufa]
MSTSFSLSRSPASARLQLGGASRLRFVVAEEAAGASPPRRLRLPLVVGADYLASHVTTDLAYSVILEHTLAEKERRYKPSEDTLQQIDRFCWLNICQNGLSMQQHFLELLLHHGKRFRRLSSLLSKSFNSQLSPANNKDSLENKEASALSVSNSPIVEEVDGIDDLEFIALDVLKWRWCGDKQLSLLSTESDHVPSPQDTSTHNFLEVGAAALFVGDMEAKMKGQSWRNFGTTDMPYLDQLLQPSLLTTITSSGSIPSGNKIPTSMSVRFLRDSYLVARFRSRFIVNRRSLQLRAQAGGQPPLSLDLGQNLEFLIILVLPSSMSLCFLIKLIPSNLHADEKLPNIFEPCPIHLIADVALSRTSPCRYGTLKEDSPLSTFRPRARPLFQYRHYSEQQPLRLNPAEVCEVIAVVCSETPSPNANLMTISSKLSNNSGKPSMDVAVSVLIKLVIDMYVLDSGSAAPLTLSMLEEMLNSPRLASKSRAFDLILNLGVHGHLLEPMIHDDISAIEEEAYFDNEALFATQGNRKPDYSKQMENSSATNNFETWILGILYEILLHLVQIQEKDESVWASALSCLLYFVCDGGKIRRNRLEGLDIRVVKVLIEISRRNSWAEIVLSKLICMLTNMFYQASDITALSTSKFLVEQVDLIGGIEFIFLELVLSNSREERRNLYLVLFDYVLHLINETCIAAGVSEYSDDEIQPIATLLILADAPEAFYISVKLGVEGIGELLRRSISAALCSYPNSDRLNTLLEKIAEKLDTFTSSFSHLDKEFGQIVQITKSYKSMENIEDGILGHTVGMKVKLSWSTLHSLIHSERLVCRQNGYAWLGDLLMEEISGQRDANILSNIRNLRQKNDPCWWGFLYLLERLLMRCKFLLDENELQNSSSIEAAGQVQDNSRLEKANAMIDIMSSALSLVAQINETDRINILKMCDILFSQLCLKVIPSTAIPFRDTMHHGKVFRSTDRNKKADAGEHFPQEENVWLESMEEMKSRLGQHNDTPFSTDNIALGVSVGSKGRGNLPGATSDIRSALLLLLIGKCTADPAAFQEVGGEEFFRVLLDDRDSRVAYYSSTFLLKNDDRGNLKNISVCFRILFSELSSTSPGVETQDKAIA